MGASPPGKSASQLQAEQRQKAEDSRTSEELKKKRQASYRSNRGRQSLISGEETGITDKTTLG
jgi:hypothetical protein